MIKLMGTPFISKNISKIVTATYSLWRKHDNTYSQLVTIYFEETGISDEVDIIPQ